MNRRFFFSMLCAPLLAPFMPKAKAFTIETSFVVVPSEITELEVRGVILPKMMKIMDDGVRVYAKEIAAIVQKELAK